jgi:hypothetical protein
VSSRCNLVPLSCRTDYTSGLSTFLWTEGETRLSQPSNTSLPLLANSAKDPLDLRMNSHALPLNVRQDSCYWRWSVAGRLPTQGITAHNDADMYSPHVTRKSLRGGVGSGAVRGE